MCTYKQYNEAGYNVYSDLQLYFAALLRLPRTMSKEEKLLRVDAVITALGLEKCRNTIIGAHQCHTSHRFRNICIYED